MATEADYMIWLLAYCGRNAYQSRHGSVTQLLCCQLSVCVCWLAEAQVPWSVLQEAGESSSLSQPGQEAAQPWQPPALWGPSMAVTALPCCPQWPLPAPSSWQPSLPCATAFPGVICIL